MGRKNTSSFTVTTHELTFIQHIIGKRALPKNLPKLKSDRERKIVVDLNQKLEELAGNLPKTGPIVIKASRNEARLVQQIAQTIRNSLLVKIIPGYQARGDERHLEYAAQAMKEADMMNNLANKIEQSL